MGKKSGAGEKIVILDRGNVEIAMAKDWVFKPNPAGYMEIIDPTDPCKLELSYLRLPPLGPGAPSLADMLRAVLREPLQGGGHPSRGESAPKIVVLERPDLRIAWAEYDFAADDTEKGIRRRPARGRWLIASNGLFQVLATFHYWRDDESWAVPAWQRMIDSLNLGHGVPLKSAWDHWSLRDRR